MASRKNYESPLMQVKALNLACVLLASGGDDFGDWETTTWGITGGDLQ